MTTSIRPQAGQTRNRLLDILPPKDFKPLASALESVPFSRREVVFRPNDLVEYLYFPITTVLSLTIGETPEDGRRLEFASVGREGMVGVAALLGVPNSLHHVVCGSAGDCWRLPVAVLAEAMVRRPSVDNLVKRYMAVAYSTAVQAVVCNALHTVEQRICRWLLCTHEMAAGEVPATQDLLAAALGVKRPTVSLVANSLQKTGLISYHRGTVRLLDPAALEQSACVCYRVTKGIYESLINR